MFVGDFFHPVGGLAVEHFDDGDVGHGREGCGAVPMLFARLEPDDVTRSNFLDRSEAACTYIAEEPAMPKELAVAGERADQRLVTTPPGRERLGQREQRRERREADPDAEPDKLRAADGRHGKLRANQKRLKR